MKTFTTAVAEAAELYDNSIDGVAIFDRELRCRYWSDVMTTLSGISRVEALRSTAYDLQPALRERELDRQLLGAIEGVPSSADTVGFRVQRALPPQALRVFYRPLIDARGVVQGCIAVVRNRLDHKELTQKVREADARFQRMADCSPVLLWMSDTAARCIFFNQTWLLFTGRTLEQEQGVGWAEGVHPEDFQPCMDTYMGSFGARESFTMVYRLRRHDGAYRWILDRGTPRYAPDGEFAGFIGSCVDITEIKDVEAELRRTAGKLAATNADLESFAFAAAHDLRAPLRAISVLAELIEDDLSGTANTEIRKNLALMRGRTRRMQDLLEALLQYSRLGQAGAISTPTNVGELADDIEAMLRAAGVPAGIAFRYQGDIPNFDTPRFLLEAVLTNLITNAFKHHDRETGLVHLLATEVGEWIEFSVQDDGPGIPESFHQKAFGLFRTLHSRDDRESSGAGLALVKRAVERGGGRATIESPLTEDRGTALRFTWPKRWPEAEQG